MGKILALLFICLAACSSSGSLPNGYKLEGGAILDHRGVEIISPRVVSIGFNNDHIVACKIQQVPYADAKRMVAINLKNGVVIDSVNAANWKYLVGRIPELDGIELKKIAEERCP
ncbi:hypothetical protein [Lysobacter sp. CFH 32150]|uniref:hypothetical protein n=1 Tax=Lysobacter sp. CFH 32150 TaxID=2927128 RepID=UPI001FA7198F|nr:hypothetical protein [Lysobacter sp. CFH 32150]MCI4569493.1 hypothetical protein [Lysobacter sp. CFH 32150]